LGTGVVLFHDGLADATQLPKLLLEAVAVLFLVAGLWTPIGGAIAAITGLWGVFSGSGDPWSQILLTILGVGLALLGPGAWSVDARLFGRRRVVIPRY
jgi:uncharacterized membrane protein YphA (DoxX/SURF4 family)